MYAKYFKRMIDFCLSLIGLIVLSPLLLLLMLLGAVFMGGNPFFTQERPGKDEKIFKLIKFRTMDKVRFSGEASKLQYLPFKLAILDTTKIRELGWKPMTDIEKMFKWTLESFL